MTAPVFVVGAGIAGAACARELRGGGVAVRVLDRGHRPGGRMASKRLGDRAVDLGASYLTASDPDFRAVVDDWHARGLARPWTDAFTVLGDDATSQKSGPLRWGAPDGLRSLVTDLLSGLDLARHEVGSLDELSAPAVVLAMPDPQARRVVPLGHALLGRLDREFEPVLALAASWPERTWDAVSPDGRFEAAFVNDDPALAWVADDGRRRGDEAPVLVAHSTPDLARRHLADPGAAAPALVRALRGRLGVAEPTSTHVHRWSFARPVGKRDEPFALHDDGHRLVGVCGDGWGATAKVETAWTSGRDLGRALVERLG